MMNLLAKYLTAKYRNIIIAIGMFIVLDASILGMNFYISNAISNDAIGVNLAGRLSTLSQTLIKSLYEIRDAANSKEDSARHLEELQQAYQAFDEAFLAFYEGGTISSSQGDAVYLQPVNSDVGREALNKINHIWSGFKNTLSPVVGSPEHSTDTYYIQSLNDAISFARANNQSLLTQINTLSDNLETIATNKAKRLRLVQMIGIVMALINFVVILFHFIANLRENDLIIEEARRQNKQILETVKEGLFLIDNKLVIGNEHSDNMFDFFGISHLQYLTLDGLLEDMVTSSTLETTKEYIQLLFDIGIKENLVKDLNPLDRMEVHTLDENGVYISKYLEFRFNRVNEGNVIKHVLVTVNDTTQLVRLENELAEAQKIDNSKNNLLVSLLPLSPSMIAQFLTNCRVSVAKINNLLRVPSKSSDEHRDKIEVLFNETHKIKGEASVLELKNVQMQAHKLEDILQTLRDQADLTGDDFLPFTILLNRLIDMVDSIQDLNHQLHQQRKDIEVPETKSSSRTVGVVSNHSINSLAQKIAEDQNKSVNVLCSGLEDQFVPDVYKDIFRGVIIQLVRNAVAHGIETIEARNAAGKQETGTVEVILLSSETKGYELRINDDGRGLDAEKIREKAISLQKWDENTIAKWNDKQLMSLIFSSGFSTSEQVNEHSGRGVGMNLIREQVRQQGGTIRIATKQGRYMRLTVSFPPIALKQSKIA